MIEKIFIEDVASFQNTQEIEPNVINYIYGANGTGKTTISRIINNCYEYKNCKLQWKNNNKLKTLVYNEDFVTNNISEKHDNIKGVFTLGEESNEKNKKISNLLEKKKEINETINSYKGTLKEKQTELSNLTKKYEKKCWKYKKQYENDFKKEMKGVLNSKNKFLKKCVKEDNNNNNNEVREIEELKKKKELLYDKDINKLKAVKMIEKNIFQTLHEKDILKKVIIGKEDLDISEMIKELENSDWVKKGKKYLEKTKDKCPFCQQELPDNFKKQLGRYFDENYEKSINKLKKIKSDYEMEYENIKEKIHDISELDKETELKEKISTNYNLFQEKYKNNINKIENKIKNPTIKIELKPLTDDIHKINKIIKKINSLIEEHNSFVNNKFLEREKLENEVWEKIVDEIELDDYKEKKGNLKKAINGIKESIQEEKKELTSIKGEIQNLENSIKSIKPTINKINKLLENFGFDNFKLTEADKKGHYKIIRENGKPVKDTLSEGERNFITFLYFYHVIKGSVSNSNESITSNRIIVIDDPVSSLDSDILFIVSFLIKNLVNEVIQDDKITNIKQIFIFTHNVYFHKQVSFSQKRKKFRGIKNNIKYWIIRKNNIGSCIKSYNSTNPIKNSYYLLWNEIREYKNNSNKILNFFTIQNILRRILETYFNLTGDNDYYDIIDEFKGDKKNICKSLIKWLHSGSHQIYDDYHIDSHNDQTINKYIDVFRKIFENTGHINHYKMMMGEDK